LEIARMNPQENPASNWQSWPLRQLGPHAHDTGAARAVRLLQQAWARGAPLSPWLGFPQWGSNAGFGPQRAPLPIGALQTLWASGHPFVQPCPACRAQAFAIHAAGHPSVGGLDLVCTTCDRRWHQPIGGLRRVMQVMNERALAGGEFEATGPQPHGDSGQALADALGVELERPLTPLGSAA
jgi:hypothetical protein